MKNLFKWEKPKALPSKMFPNKEGEYTWEDWEKEMKKKHPYRFFMYETIPDNVVSVFRKIDRKLYWLKSVTYKKQHLLDLRQPKNSAFEYRYGYSDPRQKLIYAVFAVLEFFIKECRGIENAKLTLERYRKAPAEERVWAEGWIDAYSTFIDVYNWWKNELPIKLKNLDKNYSIESENAIEKEINEKIKQLIDYREYMWT